MLVDGKISPETYEEWNRETGGKELPERVKQKAKRKTAKRKTAKRKTAKRKTAKRKTAKRKTRKTMNRRFSCARRLPCTIALLERRVGARAQDKIPYGQSRAWVFG